MTEPTQLPRRMARRIQVDPELGCWLWDNPVASNGGYGKTHLAGRQIAAHRAVYQLLVGEIPFGMFLDHLCLVPACVNPEHLEPVTWSENNRRAGLRRRKDVCVRGHLMQGENLYITPSTGTRQCRECMKIRHAEWLAANVEHVQQYRRDEYRNRSPEQRQRDTERKQDPEYKRQMAEEQRQRRKRMLASGRKCSVDGCDKPVSTARGLCSTHYNRWRADTTEQRCSADGCDSPAKARGLCATHYSYWWRTRTEGKPCSVDGCDLRLSARDMCNMHYQRWYYQNRRRPYG